MGKSLGSGCVGDHQTQRSVHSLWLPKHLQTPVCGGTDTISLSSSSHSSTPSINRLQLVPVLLFR